MYIRPDEAFTIPHVSPPHILQERLAGVSILVLVQPLSTETGMTGTCGLLPLAPT
jgi:hypothetical protein